VFLQFSAKVPVNDFAFNEHNQYETFMNPWLAKVHENMLPHFVIPEVLIGNLVLNHIPDRDIRGWQAGIFSMKK